MTAHVAPIHWSYSSLKNFEGCPQRYWAERETGQARSVPTEHTLYGERLHSAVEDYVKTGVPIPDEFAKVRPVVDMLIALPGVKYSELDLSLRTDLSPCTAEDLEVWVKAFADLVVHQPKRALVADFKTGASRYADMDQLDLYALCIFQHFPAVEQVRGMLLFIRDDRPFTKNFSRNDMGDHWARWIRRIGAIKRARDLNVWPTRPSGLCKFCPHTRCVEHPTWKF
jgi:hypothetical protein